MNTNKHDEDELTEAHSGTLELDAETSETTENAEKAENTEIAGNAEKASAGEDRVETEDPPETGKTDSRLATSIAVLTAIVVLAAGCAVWFGVEAGRLSEGDPSANLALVDEAATAEVADQVGDAVKAIFSYDYANLDRTERAAGGLLVDKAVNQYRDSFAAAKRQAEAEKLVRTTTIRSAGVRELRADSARLLVFLDQQTLRPGENGQTSSAAHLDVHARKIDGSWKIAELTAL